MSTITKPPTRIPPGGDFYRLTVDQYERMVGDGTIAEDAPVELLDGMLVRKMPKGPRHEVTVWMGRRQIESSLPVDWHLRVEASVRIPDYDEPQPDISVIRGSGTDYLRRHPGPGDVGLIVEVAETSLRRDRGEKLENYGRADIPVYWIINLIDDQLEVYSGPVDGAYPPHVILGPQESVELILDGQVIARIAVSDLIPDRP